LNKIEQMHLTNYYRFKSFIHSIDSQVFIVSLLASPL